jgi:HPt (histidine-containing phosphotransfer) domain-containing protein
MAEKPVVSDFGPDGERGDIAGPPFDLAGCLNLFSGDRAKVLALILEFSNHLELQIRAIAGALADADHREVGRIAHSIKGGAAVLAARTLMNAASVLEETVRTGDLTKSEDAFRGLTRAVDRFRCYCGAMTGRAD